MKHEYIILSVFGGWLLRGVFSAYRQRSSLTPMQMAKVIIFGGGGPQPEK
jgi:hypothetical protein